MRIVKSTHPKLFGWLSDVEGREIEESGIDVDDAQYKAFRDEADIVCPHMTNEERDAWAAFSVLKHPGFHEHAVPTAHSVTSPALEVLDKTHSAANAAAAACGSADRANDFALAAASDAANAKASADRAAKCLTDIVGIMGKLREMRDAAFSSSMATQHFEQESKRWLKRTLGVAITSIVIMALLLAFAIRARGQEKPALAPVLARASAEAPTPVTEKFHARIRDVQVDQAKWKEQLLNLRLQQAEAEKKIAEYDEAIKKIAYEAALEQKVDVTQYDLDIGTMKWVKRSKKP